MKFVNSALLFALFMCCAHTTIAQAQLRAAGERFAPVFNTTKDLMEWSKKELGQPLSDMATIRIGDIEVFSLLWDYGSGAYRHFVFLFIRINKVPDAPWILFCTRNTFTKARVEADDRLKEIVILAESGKVILSLPYDGLNPERKY